MGRKKLTQDQIIRNFWSKVDRRSDAECWLWLGCISHNGTSCLFSMGRSKNVVAQRFAWELLRGEMPKGVHPIRQCTTHRCVNPYHIVLGKDTKRKEEPLVRFAAGFTRCSPDECWPWTGWRDPDGYGKMELTTESGLETRAHRVSWILHFGRIPESLCVLHRCDNPPCVNPEHLFLGTNEENTADRKAKGRSASGDRNGMRMHPESVQRGSANALSKLTENDVLLIKSALRDKESLQEIANRHSVSKQSIWRIKQGLTWTHVADQ